MSNPLIDEPVTFPDFGPYLSFKESIKSATAIRKGFLNMPSPLIYQNMVKVYHDFYVPICDRFGKIPVSSFYRSPELNAAIGGARNSAHLYGCAIDLDCDSLRTVSNKMLFEWIRANLKFDQLILENPDQHNNPAWVHVAHNRDGEADRMQVLKMIWVKGKQVYQAI